MSKNKEPKLFYGKPYIFWVFIASILILFLLTIGPVGSTYMWGDESLRAMMGNSTKIKGYPTHWDGTRFVVGVPLEVLSKSFSDKYVEISSWLQYYLLAASYSVFGLTTFSSRLPFWIAGYAIFAFLYLYRRLLPNVNKVFTITCILLLLNATFLVYTVQTNYYIYALLLTLVSSFLFIDIIRQKQVSIKNISLLIVVNFLLAHNHIPTAITMFIVQGIFLAVMKWKSSMQDKIRLSIYVLISGGLLFTAYKLYSSNNAVNPGKYFIASLVVSLTQLNFYIISGFGMLIVFFVAYKYRTHILGKLWLLYTFALTVLHLILLAYFNYAGSIPFRYISSYMVLWFICFAIIISYVPKKWGVTIFCLIIFVNLFSGISKLFNSIVFPKPVTDIAFKQIPTIPLISNNPKIRCFYCEYMSGVFVHKRHPLENVIAMLNEINVKDRKIAVGPCEGNTIMFYTKGIVIDSFPEELYQKVYGKKYEFTDADVIVNNAFCPTQGLDHQKIVASGYKFGVINLTQEAFINDGEFNVRSDLQFPFVPQAIIYVKSANFPQSNIVNSIQ